MINPVSSVLSGIKKLFTKNPKPYREKISKACVFLDGIEYTRKVNLVREYENPNAKAILKQIRALRFPATKDKDEFVRLNEELGHSRIIDLNLEKRIKQIKKKIKSF